MQPTSSSCFRIGVAPTHSHVQQRRRSNVEDASLVLPAIGRNVVVGEGVAEAVDVRGVDYAGVVLEEVNANTPMTACRE
jgi:hypothetical protein